MYGDTSNQTSRKNAVRRSATGHRMGQDHQKVKAPDSVVNRARHLREKEGWTYRRISEELNVPLRTVADWCWYATRP